MFHIFNVLSFGVTDLSSRWIVISHKFDRFQRVKLKKIHFWKKAKFVKKKFYFWNLHIFVYREDLFKVEDYFTECQKLLEEVSKMPDMISNNILVDS